MKNKYEFHEEGSRSTEIIYQYLVKNIPNYNKLKEVIKTVLEEYFGYEYIVQMDLSYIYLNDDNKYIVSEKSLLINKQTSQKKTIFYSIHFKEDGKIKIKYICCSSKDLIEHSLYWSSDIKKIKAKIKYWIETTAPKYFKRSFKEVVLEG
jgi:hypothetical protein